jgi:YD repeat-containing protein
VFTWSYNGGVPDGVSEDGRELLSLEYNQAGLLSAVVFDNKRSEVDYGERPLTESLMGQTAIKQLVPALSGWKYPDGKKDAFKFGLTPDRVPTLIFTDRDLAQTTYLWDATTSYIISEQGPHGDWKYQVGAISTQLGLPALTRTDSKGKTEGIAIDTQMGNYTALAESGATTVTHVFETPGPLYHKTKSIDRTVNGITTTIYKASYDELGRLIRKTDIKGFVTTYDYGNGNKPVSEHTSLSNDPELLKSLKVKEDGLLKKLEAIGSGKTKYSRDQAWVTWFYFISTMNLIFRKLPHSFSNCIIRTEFST